MRALVRLAGNLIYLCCVVAGVGGIVSLVLFGCAACASPCPKAKPSPPYLHALPPCHPKPGEMACGAGFAVPCDGSGNPCDPDAEKHLRETEERMRRGECCPGGKCEIPK